MQAKYKFALALATGFSLGAGAIHGLHAAAWTVVGASVPLDGRKHSKRATRLVWSCAPLTRVSSLTARSLISNASQ